MPYEPKPVLKTKKAWVAYFKRHKDLCFYEVPLSEHQFAGDKISMKPADYVEMLIKEKCLEPVTKEQAKTTIANYKKYWHSEKKSYKKWYNQFFFKSEVA
jgi:hypothetical protein